MGSEASPPGTHGIYSARRRVLAGRLHAPVAPFFFSRFVNLGGWSIRFRTFEIPAWGKSNVACSCSCSHHPSASQSAGACSPKPVSCRRPPRAIVIDHSTVQMVWCTHWPAPFGERGDSTGQDTRRLLFSHTLLPEQCPELSAAVKSFCYFICRRLQSSDGFLL